MRRISVRLFALQHGADIDLSQKCEEQLPIHAKMLALKEI
jgi:hypothetical protein